MALNFPQDTSNPYIDSESGIKYVYNTAIGAWEAALQPPVILSATEPDLTIEGFLWWDTDDLQLYVYQGGAWQTAGAPAGGAGTSSVTVSNVAPVSATLGDLWWDTETGNLFIYYVDGDGGAFWTEANQPLVGQSNAVTSSPTAPIGPQDGDLWLNTTTNLLYIRSNNAWVATQADSTGVDTVSGTSPVAISGTASDPVIAVSGATTTNSGVIRLATQSEVNAGTNTNTAVTPATLSTAITTSTISPPAATDSSNGVVQLATSAEATSGTGNLTAMTPALVAEAIIALGSSLGNPVGTIITFGAATAPSGYLACDGSVVSRTDYADLFAAIGTQYGSGDGSTTFQIPDLRGEFVRGWDNGRGIDSGRSFATVQSQDIESHNHTASVTDPGHTHPIPRQQFTGTSTPRGYISDGYTVSNLSEQDTFSASTNISVSVNNSTGTETRPRNVSVLYCIKF